MLESLLTRSVSNQDITVKKLIFFNDRFADDKDTWEIDRQFLWGQSLLISPVLEEVKTGSF